LNALFMIASSLIAGLLLKSGFTIPQIFLFTGIANTVVAFYIFMLVPEYLLRFLAWVLSHVVYRFKVTGDEHIPTQGAAILACNHVSFVDAVLLMAASPRPIYFIMDHRIFQVPVLGWLFRLAKAIPIAPRVEDPVAYEAAFDAAAKVLKEGDLLAIFPEGGITKGRYAAGIQGWHHENSGAHQPAGFGCQLSPWRYDQPLGLFFSRVETGGAMVCHSDAACSTV
jgi:1-acyl-sn-glycerol-3-phosphate acyltransferase